MEINTTILQGLADVISGNQTRPEQSESAQIHSPVPIFQKPVDEHVNGTEVPISLTEASRTGDGLRILSVGEREILSLLFGEQRELEGSIYQSQTSKPAALGNFVDIRG
jgi:hypothetical protein